MGRARRTLLAAGALGAAAGCIPQRDNPNDPLFEPKAQLRLADATDAATGSCLPAASEASWPTVNDAPRGHCLVLDATGSVAAEGSGAALTFSFARIDPDSGSDLADLGDGLASQVLTLSTAQKAAMPLGAPLGFRVDARSARGAVGSARVSAVLSNLPPILVVPPLRVIPLGALSWSGATSLAIDYDGGASHDPDFDPLSWCWTRAGRAPGTPGDPATCDSTTPVLSGVPISLLTTSFGVAHLVVDDGSGPSAPASSRVAVLPAAPWISTTSEALRMDPILRRVVSAPTARLTGNAAVAGDTIVYDEGRGSSPPYTHWLAFAPLGDPANPTAFDELGNDPMGVSFAIDDSTAPGTVWTLTATPASSAASLAAIPVGSTSIAPTVTIPTAGPGSLVAAGGGFGWVVTPNELSVFDAGGQPAVATIAGPTGMIPAALALRPGSSGEAWALWSSPTGQAPSRLLRYELTGSTLALQSDTPLAGPASFLAFGDGERAWTVVQDEGLEELDVDAPGGPTPELVIPMSDVVGLASDPVGGDVWAAADDGTTAWFVGVDGSARAVPLLEATLPVVADGEGGWISRTTDNPLTISRALGTPEALAVVHSKGPFWPSWLDGGLWSVTTQPSGLEQIAADGTVVRRIDGLSFGGAPPIPVPTAFDVSVSGDGSRAWLVTDAGIARIDLGTAAAGGAPSAEWVPGGSSLSFIGVSVAGDFVWGMLPNADFATVASDGTVVDHGSTYNAFNYIATRWLANDSLCLASEVAVGTTGAFQIVRMTPQAGATTLATVRTTVGFSGIDDARLSAADGSDCWLASWEHGAGGAGLIEVFSISTGGVAARVIDEAAPNATGFGGDDLFVPDANDVWIVTGATARHDARAGAGWSSTDFVLPAAADPGDGRPFANP